MLSFPLSIERRIQPDRLHPRNLSPTPSAILRFLTFLLTFLRLLRIVVKEQGPNLHTTGVGFVRPAQEHSGLCRWKIPIGGSRGPVRS